MVASEVAPWAKTGGLADVVAALPEALEQLGHRTLVVMPRYRGIALPKGRTTRTRIRLGPATHEIAFHDAALSELRRIVFVDAPMFFDRDGYYGVGGQDFVDNAERFALLAQAALDFAEHDDAAAPIDVVHAHDWQAGLAPLWLRVAPGRWPRLAAAGLVFTIHNLAYQGVFAREVVPALGLPWDVFRVERGEFWGRFSFLKAGINCSDYVTTVSPTYARETQQPEFGFGLEGVLAARGDRYLGILNGVDTRLWNPATDRWLPARYDADATTGKRACKRALLARFGLAQGDDALDRPVVALVSRLIDQKGLGLIADAREALVALDVTWIFVGTGDARYELALRELAARHPTRVGVYIGFDQALAHLVEAGADMFLMPSLFEPCGLSQLYSLRYGTVPIVRAVGGLEDTVQPYTARARRANGFKFRRATADALVRAVRQAVRLYHDPDAWHRLMRQGMIEDHSWETSAREYVRVYRRARHDAAIRGAGAASAQRKE
jgi:starch synthase